MLDNTVQLNFFFYLLGFFVQFSTTELVEKNYAENFRIFSLLFPFVFQHFWKLFPLSKLQKKKQEEDWSRERRRKWKRKDIKRKNLTTFFFFLFFLCCFWVTALFLNKQITRLNNDFSFFFFFASTSFVCFIRYTHSNSTPIISIFDAVHPV